MSTRYEHAMTRCALVEPPPIARIERGAPVPDRVLVPIAGATVTLRVRLVVRDGGSA